MKCLVTGGARFIGSHIIEHLLEGGYHVVCLDSLDASSEVTIKEANIDSLSQYDNFEFLEGDIRNKGLLRELVTDVDYIFHEAALVSVLRV